ncbi:MAG: AAA family ATPase, partial [Patescibacteria group bacterium]
LKSLHIHGFKSFAKKADLTFNTAITGVVGPNGSGKSNVVEAFRFVLGEQSLKSMRGKKGEDMIFNGGKDIGRSNRAGVKVVFDNGLYDINGQYKRLFDSYSFDEVVIERAVNRDGSNEYSINGSACRLKDITELLSEANIGGSGHHIISQGEADRLLSSSNKERKEMIEDALGLKIHQYKKEESEKRLAKTKEHMREVESLRRELAPHLRFLKKQVEKIEKAKEVRTQLVELYKEYFAYEKVLLAQEESHIKNIRIQPAAEFAELEQKLKEIQNTLSVTDTTSILTDELFRLEQELKNARHTKDGYSREIGRYEGEISYIERSIEKKKEKKDVVKEEIDIPVSRKGILDLIHKIKTTLHDIRTGTYSTPEEVKQASADLITLCESYVESVKDASQTVENDIYDTKEEETELVRIQALIAHAEKESVQAEQNEQTILNQYEAAKKRIEQEKEKNVESEKELLKVISRQHEVRAELDKIDVRNSMYITQKESYEREMMESAALVGLAALHFDNVNVEVNIDPALDKDAQRSRLHTLEKFKIRLEELGGAGDDTVHREYTETEERDLFLANELQDLETSLVDLEKLIVDITQTVADMFKTGIDKINSQFSTFFKQMFGGGEARLVITQERKRKRKLTDIEDDEDMEESSEEGEMEVGIDVFISLPHKKLKGLAMLSGGERALTSIALLFAMSQVNPPPFIILDETDAALDEANSRRYGDMIELLSNHSELILVTHNRETMSRAGVLYGVTMGTGGYSQLLSIGFEEASVNAK